MNHGDNLHYPYEEGSGNGCLDLTPKLGTTKEKKIGELDFLKGRTSVVYRTSSRK